MGEISTILKSLDISYNWKPRPSGQRGSVLSLGFKTDREILEMMPCLINHKLRSPLYTGSSIIGLERNAPSYLWGLSRDAIENAVRGAKSL